jgi:hypothetical protein
MFNALSVHVLTKIGLFFSHHELLKSVFTVIYFSFLFFCRKRFFQTLEDQFSVIGLAAQESGENCNK